MKTLDEIGVIGLEDSSDRAIPYSILISEESEKEKYNQLLLDFNTTSAQEETLKRNNHLNVKKRLIELMGSYFQHHGLDLNDGRIFQTGERDQHIIYNGPRTAYSKFLHGGKHLHFFEHNNKLCVTSSIEFYSPLDWDHKERPYSKISVYLLVKSFKDSLSSEVTSRKIEYDKRIVYVSPLDNLSLFDNWTARIAPHLIQANLEDYCALYEAYQRITKDRNGDRANQRELIIKQHLKNAFELEMNKIKAIITNRDEI
ncbi:hypothetical protein HYU21_00525 [Candidatus Woesearchaeota archaeon]|nr:hypothetical protein [Candidatus Woesearchaeota archaeon]